jgi:glycosyltransferase involved in cell wall biosynthesis
MCRGVTIPAINGFELSCFENFETFGVFYAHKWHKITNMKIAYLATYTPRQCGIGTFTKNKFEAISANEEHKGIIIAMDDQKSEYDYPDEVQFKIRQDEQADYIDAAKFINKSGADICIIEHEFGIFGGRDGAYLLPLMQRLNIPAITVFHTVLKTPSHSQKNIIKEIAAMSAMAIVMTPKAVEFLTQIYSISGEKISIIDHGIPAIDLNHQDSKKELGLQHKNVILTFGLIGRNKGIETVLKALPQVIKEHPETVYIILGKTHPAVLRNSGEEYREYLKALSEDLNIQDNIIFKNEFVDENKLSVYLSAADIYVTPYLNEAQITSGTLSYAVGAGCAVISTPYWHAADLLTKDKGRLFNFNDSDQLSSLFLELLGDKTLLNKLRSNAKAYGSKVTWPKIGEEYVAVAQTIIHEENHTITTKELADERNSFPPFALDHIKRMTDDTGLIQHAKYGIPNLKEGYCLDDNARALLMVLMAYKQKKHLQAVELLPVYLSYIHYMQNDDGTFRNFLSFNRNFLDTVGSEDSFGRTIWALGYLLGNAPNDAHYRYGKEIFFNAVPNFEKLQYIRGIANTMMGISYYLQDSPDDAEMKAQLKLLANKLMENYREHSTETWKWFEPVLTYDNAILPLAMLHAADVLNDRLLMDAAMESMDFLSCIVLKNGCLSVIGNEKWYAKDCNKSLFAQQPIDAMMMVLLFEKAFLITGEKSYLRKLHTSFMWFLGENDLQVHLYDRVTKGCRDGLESYGANQNQGAESTLAYLISLLALMETYETNKETLSGNMNTLNFMNAGIAV